MTQSHTVPDLAQRVAEALARTTDPKPPKAPQEVDEGVVVGSVPMHLRHLHNLVTDLGVEMVLAQRELEEKRSRANAVAELFWGAMKQHLPITENSAGIYLLNNWDVVVAERSDDLARDLAEALNSMFMGETRSH